MREGLRRCGCDALLILSDRDIVAAEFSTLCKTDTAWGRVLSNAAVSWSNIRNADHTFSSGASLDEAVRECEKWLLSRMMVSTAESRNAKDDS